MHFRTNDTYSFGLAFLGQSFSDWPDNTYILNKGFQQYDKKIIPLLQVLTCLRGDIPDCLYQNTEKKEFLKFKIKIQEFWHEILEKKYDCKKYYCKNNQYYC